MKKLFSSIIVAALTCVSVAHAEIPQSLITAAQKEGELSSIGMPDSWANWVQTWQDLKDKYGIEHHDTDMSSGEEIAKFKAEGRNASADIGDVGIAFGPLATKMGLLQPYKTTHWDSVPDWAKDKDGYWMVAYTGSMAFIIDNNQIPAADVPHSWKDLLSDKFHYKLTMGKVGTATQANMSVLSAAYAFGGNEGNLKPGLDFFAKLAKAGKLSTGTFSKGALERGEIAITPLWDFNALNYRDQIDHDRFTVVIPTDGSVISGYTEIINKYAKHPNAAKLVREYIFSDAGQINLARGYARPIRADVKLPADVQAKLLPAEDYKNVRPIKDWNTFTAQLANLGQSWQQDVLTQVK